nr:hypothetical protein [uncultured Ruminococcus sp.]
MHFLMLLISDSALLPFSATGGGRKATSSPVTPLDGKIKSSQHKCANCFLWCE